ncbi:MAG: gliding motility-associated C-terminal domain-containing protein [Lentimicrobium sp.]
MKRLLILILCIISTAVSAQREADNWIFGWSSWISFSSGTPAYVPAPNGLFSFYGSTSLSDSAGNLLFYSDGIELFNRNYDLMLNSDGLMAAAFATNPCIAFPKPGDPGKYYFFTVGGRTGTTNRAGSEYSVIDMDLDGGLGGIIEGQKNITLIAADSTYETIQGVKHGSRDAYWVILRNHRSPNKFLSYLVDQSGVNQTPVVSNCILNFPAEGNQSEYMKISADGKYLVFADRNGTAGFMGMTEIYRFNNVSGQLTPVLLFNRGSQSVQGIEFSANSDYLYMSEGIYRPSVSMHERWIAQYEMSKATDLTQFMDAKVVMVRDSSVFGYGNLLLANNGKIYFAQSEDNGTSINGYLSAINNPSAKGEACNIELMVVETFNPWEGLPTFISSFMAEFEWTGSCEGDTIKFDSRFSPAPVSWLWNFGDPASGAANTSSDADPRHIYSAPGEYEVSVTVVFPNGTQHTSTRNVHIFSLPVFSLGDTIRICEGGSAVLTPGPGYASYLWSNGSSSPQITVNTPGEYWVEVRNQGDCSFTDTLQVVNHPAALLITDDLVVSPTTCGGQTGAITGLSINGQPPFTYYWTEIISGNPAGHTPNLYNLGVGIYQLNLTDGIGCNLPATNFEIRDVGNLLIDTVTNTNALCNEANAEIYVIAVSGLGSRIQYFIRRENDTLTQWHNGLFTGLEAGVYYAWASDSTGCTSVYGQPVIVTSPDGPEITDHLMLPATAGQPDGTIILSAQSAAGDTIYYTVNGITQINDGYFDDLPAGDYLCEVTDENGCSTYISITITTLEIVYLNAIAGEGSACSGNPAVSPLYVSNFNGVRSFKVTLTYDPAIMECLGHLDVNSLLQAGMQPYLIPEAGKIIIEWAGSAVVSLPDDAKMLDLVFEAGPEGASELRWDAAPGVNLFLDNNGLSIPVDYTNGNMVVTSAPGLAEPYATAICEGSSFTYTPEISGGTGEMTYKWKSPSGETSAQAGLTVTNATTDNAGTYALIVTDALGCSDSTMLTLQVTPNPRNWFLQDTILFENQYLLAGPAGYASYLWSTGDTMPEITVNTEGLYTLQLTTHNLCAGADSTYLKMLEAESPFLVPNAFTPNNDGLNDAFRPVLDYERVRMFSMVIYNRWGQVIFETTNPAEGWDGQDAPSGVYTWTITYSDYLGKVSKLRGSVTLVR